MIVSSKPSVITLKPCPPRRCTQLNLRSSTDRFRARSILCEPSAETREAANGLNVDLDADGNVIGFDIDNASRLGALLRDFIASGATVEDLARAWASPHDTREEFNKEKGLTGSEAARGNDLGYLGDIEEILQRAAKYARERKFASPSSPADL